MPDLLPARQMEHAHESTGSSVDSFTEPLGAPWDSGRLSPVGAGASIHDDDFLPLITAVAAKQDAAFATLYTATIARLKNISRAVLQSPQDADDTVSEVFVYVWTQARRYDPSRGTVMTWLATITRNRSIDRVRSRRRMLGLADAELSAVPIWSQPAEMPEQKTSEWQRMRHLHSLLATLAPFPRQLVSLAFLQGLTHQEIAGMLHLPLGTVKSNIRRALAALRAEMLRSTPNDFL